MKVIGLGAGGHAKVIIELLRLVGGYDLVGLLDPKQQLWGHEVLGVPVLGDDSMLPELYDQGLRHVFVGMGSIGDTAPRKRLFLHARELGFQMVPAIHPLAWVSPSADIGHGPTIMAGSVINAEAKLGDNVIVNSGAIVEHDCVIGHHVHIATGAKLAAMVAIEQGAHIGIGASIRQRVHIGANAVIGAGAAVVKDVPADTTVVGVPARGLGSRV